MDKIQPGDATPSLDIKGLLANWSTLGRLPAWWGVGYSTRLFMPSVSFLLFSADSKSYIFPGAVHEMMRSDRDRHVKILFRNMEPGARKQFLKKPTNTHSSRRTPFDFKSIMIYGATDFGIQESLGRKTTMVPLESGVELRQASKN